VRAFAQSIVETVRHPLLVLDRDLAIVAANRAAEAFFDVPGEQVVGLSIFAEKCQLNLVKVKDRLQKVAQGGESLDRVEVHCPLGTEVRSFLLDARRVEREEDGSARVLVAFEDVTEKKQAEAALLRLNEELEERVRRRTWELEAANREMEAFCYSVSHDLRAPLRAIDGFAQELAQTYADQVDEQGRHYLTRVRANSQRMARLIDDLLQLSRLSRVEMKREHVDLSALAAVIIADLRQRDPGRMVKVSIEPNLLAWCDPGLLRVIMENLLDNAWKFTSKKSDSNITVGRLLEGNKETFFVRDDGAGFEPRFAAKLFGAFQRLHHERDFPGTGIGLATVQRVVHRHGGSIRAEGAVGAGATFYFTLPHEIG
jgi:PAS domain S-box-containing protein